MKLNKTDLQDWLEETKDVKKIKKDSSNYKDELLPIIETTKLKKLKEKSVAEYLSTMLDDDKSNSKKTKHSNFKTTIAYTKQGDIFSHQKSVDKRILNKLKRGQIRYQGVLDLHGLTLENAKQRLCVFLQNSYNQNKRCVLVVHGKGMSEKSKIGKIKNQIPFWLEEMPFILSFCSAVPKDGGTGALYILLKFNKG
ncbi:MAG: hypothetical protein GY793_06095 [Proteobacteria bacterium]|nr:hypothetical protein [Pseudomonadota bacterium]